MKKLVLQIIVAAIIVMIVTNANAAVEYANRAIDICIGIIVPTLFPFFICSGLLIYSGFCETLSRMFRFCMKPLFNVGAMGASAFVIGIVSGYPLGAITTGELYKNSYITKTEAERLLAFCNNSGPLFILGSVGVAMYSKISYGVMLYVCHILAAITVGVLFRFYKKNDYLAPKTVMTSPERSVGEIFSIALSNAISNMLTVCGAVLFFGVVSQLVMSYLPLEGIVLAAASGIVEFVTGSIAVSGLDIPTAQKLIITAFIVGFAGLSVHIQVMAATVKYELSLVPYVVGKVIHGAIAALYTFIYLSINPITSAVFKVSLDKSFSASAAYSGVVVIICIIAILSIELILPKEQKCIE